MISIFCKNGTVYRFPSQKVAEDWMENHGHLYGHDTRNLTIMSNVRPTLSIEIANVLHMVQCTGCGRFLKFESAPDEEVEIVICPNCGCRKRL